MNGPPFTITVARTGGFAGMRREWAIEVTDVSAAQRWQPLVEACPWDDCPDDNRPDGFVYTVRAAEHIAVLPEHQVRGPWRRLVDEVQLHAQP